MATTLVKIKFDEDLRMVEIPSPPCFSEFVKTVAEAYDLALGEAQSLTFNYKDADGDEVRFDTNAELELAIRSSPSPLHVTARSSHPRGKTTVPPHYGPFHTPRGHMPLQGPPGSMPPHGPPGHMPPQGPPGHMPPQGPPGHMPPHGPPRHMPHRGPPGHMHPHGPPRHMPPHGPPGHNLPPAMTSIPSTPGYTGAPYVGPISSENEEDEDMIILNDPREAAVACAYGSSRNENEKNDVKDIDAPAAFEAEAAAARDPEGSVLYQKASIRLATQFRVHLTPTQLWRVLALFRIQGRELVTFGLAPHHALDVNADPSTAGGESDVDIEENKDRRAGEKRSKRYMANTVTANPVHRLLELNGVVMPEDEVQPLLEALRVCPRRLVKMGLLPKEILLDMPDGHRRPRGGPHEHRLHPHRGGHPGRGRGHDRGHGHHPIHAPPPHMHPRGQHGPPHHMASMYASPPPPPHGHFGARGGAEWYGRHLHCPYPYMWHGPREMMGGGYGYSHGGWGGWDGHYGGGGCGTPERGFGKGNKDNKAMARFVAHPSGTDVTTVASGQSFKKSWKVRNDSTTTWPETCCLVPVSQSCEDLLSPPEAPVVGDVGPGEEATVSVDLVAPTQPGMYGGYWRVRDDSQRRFGQRLWAKVIVVGAGENMDAAVEKLSLDDGHRDK